MFSDYFSRTVRTLGSVGSLLIVAALPCIAWSQATPPAAGAAQQAGTRAGFVNSVTGTVFIRMANGALVPAKAGDAIDRGAVISTGGNGEVILLFPDGQHVTLNADSRLRVDEYQFDPRNPGASKANFTLLDGMMRVVTGAINAANPEALKIVAGDAVISVRSKEATSFVVESDAKVARETGSVAVIVGEVAITRPDKSTLRVTSDQFTHWQPSVSPQQPLPLGAAPAGLQALAGAGQQIGRTGSGAPDVEAAVQLALAGLPAAAAGAAAVQVQLEPGALAAAILPPVTPVGCVGSPC